jgi:triacylglycerol esterase/lipase EstA (alpha/beta hydrolase family)
MAVMAARRAMALVAAAVAAASTAMATATATAGSGPPSHGMAAATAAAIPDPVVLVEGTGSGDPLVPAVELDLLADRLEADGHTAFVFPLPGRGLGDIGATATRFAPFVDQVLAQTGASRVDVVGHSQGGLVARYYVKFLGGAGKVDSLVGLAVPHHGTKLANLAWLHGLVDCVGYEFCRQVVTGSSWLADLNGDDDTFGPVRYTNLATRLDLIVVPYTNSFQRSPGAVNVTIQQQCPLRIVEHLTLALDGTTYSGIRDALAGRPVRLNCLAL